ncbi:MAG TPA: ASKHA domain-containing protein [Roseiflexaceae bacterium]|nr:ASKHA domain-containing protein [Roseiflexaceae bacterium]
MPETLPTHVVIFQPSGRQGQVAEGTTLLDAARQLGVDVDSICGGRQTCGKCKVILEDGAFAKHAIESASTHATPAGTEERDYFAHHGWGEPNGTRLACAACVAGDLLISVPPESQARKQIIRKSATERAIAIDPTLREFYIEVEPHRLGERQGDWERLQDALRREWALEDLRIDLPALRQLGPALKAGKQRITVVLWNDAEVIDVRPGYHEGLYGLAVDVGSTTVAAHLCDLRSGAVLATEAIMNPQVTFGEDLMSRVSYAMMHDDGLQRMHQAIIAGLNKLAGLAAHAAGLRARDIHELVLAGNTVMHHILLGLDPTDLGAAPFTLASHAPIDIKARELGLKLHPGANVHFMALEAGHVGSDNVGVLVAEVPDQQDSIMLVIDVGTNAEILLGNRERLLSCSSPTGPAFEGAQIAHGQRAAPGAIERVRIDRASGQPRFKVIGKDDWSDVLAPEEIGATGICGSGIIEAVAELFMAGVLRVDGRFAPGDGVGDGDASPNTQHPIPNPRLRWNGPKAEYILATADQTATGREIVVTQDDVRNIQLAKGALYAGCKLLMRRRGVEAVDKIVLAGAFGSYIDPLHAMVLGLIPDCALENVYAVGNAAGDGARIVLLSKARRAESALAARQVEYVETAIDPLFQEEFVGAMHLPHMTDPFPHLDAIGALPTRLAASEDDRARRRRERRAR